MLSPENYLWILEFVLTFTVIGKEERKVGFLTDFIYYSVAFRQMCLPFIEKALLNVKKSDWMK